MVILSILTLGLSTDRSFQRTMTNCERLEYMESAKMADIHLFQEVLGHNCENEVLPGIQKTEKSKENRAAPMLRSQSFFPANDEIIAEDDPNFEFIPVFIHSKVKPESESPKPMGPQDGDPAEVLKVTSSFGVNQRNTSELNVGRPLLPEVKLIKVPNMKVPIYAMFVLDIVTLAFFTVDLILRLTACPSLIGYFMSVVNVLDTAALLCTYFHYLATFLRKQDLYEEGWLNLLEYVQILRALRLLRVVKNVRASRVLIKLARFVDNLYLYRCVHVCFWKHLLYGGGQDACSRHAKGVVFYGRYPDNPWVW